MPNAVDRVEWSRTTGRRSVTMSATVEERVLRCDVCKRPFVLAYRRGESARSLSDSRVTSAWIRCPAAECHHVQSVIVPFEGGIVAITEWLGSDEAARQGLSYRELLAKARR
jgi:hypothetical protein